MSRFGTSFTESTRQLLWVEKIERGVRCKKRNNRTAMPSVGLRRTTKVFRMVKSSEARVLRSGRRLWPDSGEVKPKKHNNDVDEYYHSVKKNPKSEANKAAAEVNGKPKRLGHEENPKKQSKKMKAEAVVDGGSVDRMFGIVYTRKRKRDGVEKSQLSRNLEQKKFGKMFNRKRRKTDKGVQESRMLSFVVGNGDFCGWFSTFLFLVLGYMKRAEVRVSELASFLMSQPISGIYSSNGVNLLRVSIFVLLLKFNTLSNDKQIGCFQ